MTINKLGGVDPVAKYNKAAKTTKLVKKEEKDSINVSDQAKKTAELYKAAEIAKSASEVRMDRVAEVKTKLEDPNYIDNLVLESVADKIMEQFGI